ncbi:hypothetical protein X777_16147 [Ooceraea biroi]|uniref:Uncharacterized protein n=1 Tax=Ooceraea biroi TaxID=2015173 RepID=A0A026WXS1_OOCBI|nr:hypothetical protein X777_16147 [Ooceraea biroi]
MQRANAGCNAVSRLTIFAKTIVPKSRSSVPEQVTAKTLANTRSTRVFIVRNFTRRFLLERAAPHVLILREIGQCRQDDH